MFNFWRHAEGNPSTGSGQAGLVKEAIVKAIEELTNAESLTELNNVKAMNPIYPILFVFLCVPLVPATFET